VTAAEREALAAEFRRARSEASDLAFRFHRLCDAYPTELGHIEEAARDLVLTAGRVAGFASMLARSAA
jgi:hypothetical protein